MKLKCLFLSAIIAAAALTAGCSGQSGSNNAGSTASTASQSTEAPAEGESQTADSQGTADDGASSQADASGDESKTDEKSDEQSSASKPSSDTPAGEAVDSSWFDDAVFIGDSVTLKLEYYCDDHDDLGDVQFLCAGSYSYENATHELGEDDVVHPSYNGTEVKVEDGIAQIKPKKIFIMLGMNDIGMGMEEAVENMRTITQRISEAAPDAQIYLESVTPMVSTVSLGDLNNETIPVFNQSVKALCDERGYKYMDVYSAVEDGNGNLRVEFCSDIPQSDDDDGMGLHFTEEGCQAWINYLKTHVQ